MADDGSNSAGWSREVPVTPPPIEFVFGRVAQPLPSDEPERPTEPSGPAPPRVVTPVRHWLVPLVVTVGLIGAAIGVSIVRDEPTDVTGTDFSSEATTASTSVASTTAPTTTTRSTTTVAATTVPADEELPAAWRKQTIVLPERIGATAAPMRMFALTSTGLLFDIDVQTGTMQSLDLDSTVYSARLHVARSSVLIANNSGSNNPVLVPDGGQPIEFEFDDPSGGIWVQGVAANGDDYLGESWNGESGRSTRIMLRADGSVDEIDRSDTGWRPGGASVTGEELISDAGGLYLEASDGTTRRISDGSPIAVSATSVLVRECDEQRQCAYVVIALDGGERFDAAVPEEISFNDGPYWNPTLAPDGHAMLLSSNELSGVTALFVDLLDGTTTPVTVDVQDEYGSGGAVWASDSSGVLTTDQGEIVFVDAATGEVIAVPLGSDDDLNIVDVAVRHAT